MAWHRRYRRAASWLALLALAVQLVLSFGHVHLDNSHATGLTAAAIHKGPAPNNGDKPDNDYCSICAVLTLLSGAQIATAPALPIPVLIAAVDPPAMVAAVRVLATATAFRSRAPPLS